MSLKSKFKGWNPFQQPLPEVSPATDIPPKERAQVEQLIANGKCGVAVDIAKQVHKRFGNASSEALLVDAYVARISELAERKLDVEASTLLDQVGERYPISKDRLRVVAATLKARGGRSPAGRWRPSGWLCPKSRGTARSRPGRCCCAPPTRSTATRMRSARNTRSEERRVGKER